jgi:hypothetical protein
MWVSSRIWSSMTKFHPTNINQTDNPNSHLTGHNQNHHPTGNSNPTVHIDESSVSDLRLADDSKSNSGSTQVSDHQTGHPVYPSPIGQAHKRVLMEGYTRMITDRLDLGWSCYLVTFMFDQIPGARAAVMDRMKDEVQLVYSTLLTRVHRKPRTAPADQLLVLIGSLDLQVYKRDRSSVPDAFRNSGLHFHGLVLMPPVSRLKESLADHFRTNFDLYAGRARSVERIHVEPVTRDPDRVVDYVFKTVFRGRLSHDDAVLVLPRARSELPSRSSTGSGPEHGQEVRSAASPGRV